MSGASLGVALPRWRVALVYLSWATLAVAGALGLFAIALPVLHGDWIELVSVLALAVSVAFSVEFRVYVSRSTMSRPLSFGFAMTASYLVIDPAWQVWGVFALGVAVAMATSFRPLRMALHGAGRIVMGTALFFVVMEGGEALRLPILLVAPLGVIVYAGFCQSYEFVRLRGTSDNFVPEQRSLAWGGVWAYVLGGSLIVITLQFLTNYAVESMPGVNSSLSVALVNMFLSIVLLVLSFTTQVRRINQRLHGVVSAALAMPWGRGSERREAAVRFANAALGRRNARLQTHRPGEHDLGALLEKTGDGEVFLVVSRPAGDIPFNTEDTEVLEALGHISRESRKVLENERSLSRDAYQDSLTGLPNYRAFQELLVSANDERTALQGLAVLFADIDDLKRVNDVLGHDAGNDLIRRTAAAITDTVRLGDTVARVGGDEFVVVLRNLRSLEQGEQIAQRIVERTSRIETLLDSTKFATSVSIGLSFSAHREADLDKLVTEAENNMRSVKKAKKAGSSVVSVIASSRRSSLVDAAVSEAISAQGITIAVQPIISLTTMTITGVEVLARLQNSPLGRISPTVLVEKAKALGLLNDLTLQILDQALAASRRFTEIVPGLTAVCVNAELSQFGDGRFTEAVLAAARDNPDVKVVMELNERSITGVTPEFRAQAERLRAGGVLLSLDEYGAPASSLATVIELPLDYVKVDRHLVSDMAVDDRQRDLLAAFVRLAEQLGIVMIVEGVEEEATHDALVALGVPRVQGFYYGRPMSVEAMLERLSTHGPAATV